MFQFFIGFGHFTFIVFLFSVSFVFQAFEKFKNFSKGKNKTVEISKAAWGHLLYTHGGGVIVYLNTVYSAIITLRMSISKTIDPPFTLNMLLKNNVVSSL
jgi:Na+/phosphate symporter